MKIKREEPKLKPFLKLSDDQFDLRTLDTNIIVKHLEERIKLREMSVEQHAANLVRFAHNRDEGSVRVKKSLKR